MLDCITSLDIECSTALLDFSLTVKAATLIVISGRGSAISSAKEGKSGFCLLLLPLWQSVIVLSSMFCCTLLYVHSSIAIILMGKRELIALLNLSSWCLVMVERLFLAVPWGSLQFVIVVFPDHTHLLFIYNLVKSLLLFQRCIVIRQFYFSYK